MVFDKQDKTQWHNFFPIFPRGTVCGKVVWLEPCLRRFRYVGYAPDDMSGRSDHEVEYKLKE